MYSKRNILAVLAASAFVILGSAIFSTVYLSESAADVVVVENGGSIQDALRKATWEPAAKALGMTFGEDTMQGWTEARAQVDAGAVTWDIITLGMGEVQLAVDAGVLTKLPEDIVNRDDFAQKSVNDYCVGNILFSMVIGYSTAKFGNAGPSGMVDFWDVKKFPGKRGLYRSPRGNMEAAVIALGHPQSEVYDFLSTEEGRRLALEKLAELRPYAVWWESGAQATQLIKDGEIDMIYGWDGRIRDAMAHGAPFKIAYKDGILQYDCYAIVKGAPHLKNAIVFLREISKAEYVKNLPKYGSYGSPNLKAYEDYDEATLARLTSSPKNVAEQYRSNVEFWGKNGTALSEAFDHMLLTK